MSKKDQRIIDVDVVIEKYNKNNPELKPMDRKTLAKELGVNPQVFSDWKNGRTPKLIFRILKLKEIGSCDFEDFVIKPS
jgi:hypothetical protein